MANELQLIPESKQGQAFKTALKSLDYENVLDKIRSEIEHMACRQYEYKLMLDREEVLKVFSKYREVIE